ncbi:MAG: NUDIX hydrolase [Actinobacteria bacterium]|nr:NUDIX hydrolase [Actinomycetota bacterium]
MTTPESVTQLGEASGSAITPGRDARWAVAAELMPSADVWFARRIVEDFSPPHSSPADHRSVQAANRDQVLAFIDEHHDALHRSCLTGHLTGSAWVVDHNAERGLILHHAKIQRWLQPGGHADGDANLAGVALNEATEETGIDGLEVWTAPIDIDIHLFVNRKSAEADHFHFDVRFLVRAPRGAVFVGNHESEALRWVDDAGLCDPELGLDASTVRLAECAFALARGDAVRQLG